MMNKILFLTVSVSLFLTLGCGHIWKPIFNAEVVSMTKSDFKNDHKFQDLEEVKAEYCFGEPKESVLTYKEGELEIGLIDEVIMRAQKKQNKCVALKNVLIEQSGACVRLEATAVK